MKKSFKERYVMGSLEERFWPKVQKTKRCWLWIGAKNNKGYGSLYNGISGTILAHRASWKLLCGKLSRNICVCHRCDVPLCVNPKHLFLGTVKDNVQDALSKGRLASMPGVLNPNVKLSLYQVRRIRKSYRKFPVKYLLDKFVISKTQFYRIIRKESWGSV